MTISSGLVPQAVDCSKVVRERESLGVLLNDDVEQGDLENGETLRFSTAFYDNAYASVLGFANSGSYSPPSRVSDELAVQTETNVRLNWGEPSLFLPLDLDLVIQ